MNCKYYFNSQLIGDIKLLNDFLSLEYESIKNTPDIIFLKATEKNFTTVQKSLGSVIETVVAEANKVQKAKKGKAIDGEALEMYEGDVIGVSLLYATYALKDGTILSPYFNRNAYWTYRMLTWATNANMRKLNPDGSVKEEGFTEEEYKLLTETLGAFPKNSFETFELLPSFTMLEDGDYYDIDKLPETSILSKLIKLIEQRWEYQATLGNAIHTIFKTYFQETPKDSSFFYLYESWEQKDSELAKKALENSIKFFRTEKYKGKFNQNYISEKLMSDDQIKEVIGLAQKFRQSLEKSFGKGLMFKVEVPITAKLNSLTSDQEEGDPFKTVKGRIDLLVLDQKGNKIIVDYKVGNKSYENYDSAKRKTFIMALGLYGKMLDYNNVRDSSGKATSYYISPLEIKGLTLGEDNKYSYKNLIFNFEDSNPFKNITSEILDLHTQDVLNSLVHVEESIDEEDATFTSRVNSITTYLFGDPPHKKELSLELIKNLVTDNGKKEILPNENGFYVYDITDEEQIAVKESEGEAAFLKKVQQRYTDLQVQLNSVLQNVSSILDKFDEDTSTPLIEEKEMKRLGASNIALLSKYCNASWKRVITPQALQLLKLYNILIFEGQPDPITSKPVIEIVKLSTNPVMSSYKGTSADKNNCNFKFKSNSSEEVKPDSLMLKAVQGNIDILETLIVLNESNLFSAEGVKINDIVVMNPFGTMKSKALSANPKEFAYTLSTLLSQAKVYAKQKNETFEIKSRFDFTDNNSTKTIQFASSTDLLITLFNNLNAYYTSLDQAYFFKEYEEIFEGIQEAVEEKSIESLKENIIELLRILEKKDSRLAIDYANNNRLFSEIFEFNKSNILKIMYIVANKALLQVNNFKNRQQLLDHDEFLNSYAVWNDGLHGNSIDNAGNFGNLVVNDISKLIVNTTQYIRLQTDTYRKENREDVLELDAALGKSRASQFITNPTSRFTGMTYVNSEKTNIYFINPWAKEPKGLIPNHFTNAEFDYLKKVILKLNKLRYPSEKEASIIKKLSSGNKEGLKFLEFPIMPPSLQSRIAQTDFSEYLSKKWFFLKNPSKWLDTFDRSIEGFKNNELISKESEDIIFQVTNIFSANESIERRKDLINSLSLEFESNAFYETNIELVLGTYELSKIISQAYANVMPIIRAASICLQQQAAVSKVEGAFQTDLNTIEELVKSKINNMSIQKNENVKKVTQITSRVQKAASYLTLACSPVQATGQTLDGIIKLLKLSYVYNDSKGAPFTKETLAAAYAKVISSIKDLDADFSFMELLNITFGLNDQDLNSYVSNNMESKSIGFFNLDRLAFYLTTRPDFYNRLTLFVALMMQEGVFEAYSMQGKNLVYDCTKDKRFAALWDSSASQEEKDIALLNYYAVALDLLEEDTLFLGEHKFKITNEIPPAKLPRPYSTRLIESMKALADNLYGYYDHAKKSLFQSTFMGGLMGQMKTYWSAKKNMYLGSKGVKNLGSWKKVMHPDQTSESTKGVYLCFAVNPDGSLNTNKRVWSNAEDASKIACLQWEGKFLEGILLTFARVILNDKHPLFARLLHPKQSLIESCTEDGVFNEDMYEACVINLKLFLSDLLALLLGYLLTEFFILPKAKETSKDAKDSQNNSDRISAASWNLLFLTVDYAVSDSNAAVSIFGPLTDWLPFALTKMKRTLCDAGKVLTGDESAIEFLVKDTALGKAVVKPWFKVEKDEESYFGGGSFGGSGSGGSF